MKYQYNFRFFDEWIKANPQIKKKTLLDALGVKADSGMRKWADRRYPMPVISMLRFCNSFNVPLSAFFRDMDANEMPTTIPYPTINDQLEPDGGYIKPGEERQRGESTILDPLNVEVVESNMPDGSTIPMLPRKEKAEENSSPSEPQTLAATPTLDTNALLALENTHASQRTLLLNIITNQQQTISDQQTVIAEQQRQITDLMAQLSQAKTPHYQVVKEYEPLDDNTLGMVAEPDTKI